MALSPATSLPDEIRTLSESLLSLVARPAALIVDGESVVAQNAAWKELLGCPSSSSLPTLAECLGGFSGVESLVTPLRSRSHSVGSVVLLGPLDPSSPEDAHRYDYVARWTQVEGLGLDRSYAMVVLKESTEVEHLASVISAQRVSINNLLIRQTLIEENERRRLGRAMHDGIAQELAQIRAQIGSAPLPKDMTTQLLRELDTVIESVRNLAFELSPPILEDLGIRPALHWLSEHLSERYGANIDVADDVSEPRLSSRVRTIVFRAVRELTINAVKHAGDAEIILSCVSGEQTARLGVRDTGPGFDPTAVHRSTDGFHRFGLLSVEQQIRGIGGVFEIVSSLGEGTRASITVPLERDEGATLG